MFLQKKIIIKYLQMSSPWFPLRNFRQDIKQKAQKHFLMKYNTVNSSLFVEYQFP